MSEAIEQPTTLDRRGRHWRIAAGGVVVVAAVIVVTLCSRTPDDAAIAQHLAGTWIAVDPNDATLHRREDPVVNEQLVIRENGTLSHIVELASKPGTPDEEPWGWKVRKGRLYVQFLGDDASGQWLPGFPISVSDKTLTIRVKAHPPKEWVRKG